MSRRKYGCSPRYSGDVRTTVQSASYGDGLTARPAFDLKVSPSVDIDAS
jgi:hypothetical protein